ncbi:uncharacterized protein LOC133188057 [Saccostrea echinata]|uniref:uncharacterized protein LOC133188057 n=1 Tax=Saccostrea echinata TaxID=191078 RepID=UPI002A83B430|nr:uncharacterized protein LOC133188057 [Saccostrea echinata]
MAPVYLTWFLLLYERIVCYENLCRKPGIYASQSSDRGGFPATNAVDGFYNQKYVFCAHTAPHQSKAWFQVDLGNPYRLNSVNIFYRNDITWRPYRFRQFYLDVSNTSAALSTTLTPQRVRCYKDNTTDEAIPPALIDIPCTQTAQYVIIETTYNAPENPNSGDGPMLEICEIDIYGTCNNIHGLKKILHFSLDLFF